MQEKAQDKKQEEEKEKMQEKKQESLEAQEAAAKAVEGNEWERRQEAREQEARQLEWENTLKASISQICGNTEMRLNQMLAPRFVKSDCRDQSLTVAFEIDEWEKNTRGELHGGTIAAMFDLVLGITAHCASLAHQAATADMSISYLRRVDGDDTILMTILVRKNGRQMIRLSGEARSKKTGKAVAMVQSSYMVL